MTETFYRTGNRKVSHTTFGGTIYPSDFNTTQSSGTIAERIFSDRKFDEQCKKNIKLFKSTGGNENVKRNDETKM